MAGSFTLEAPEAFPKGTKVVAYAATTDTFTHGGSPVSTSTVDADGKVKLTGLIEHADYYAASVVDGNWRAIRFQADGKNPVPDLLKGTPQEQAVLARANAEANAKARNVAEKSDKLAASPAVNQTAETNVAVGPKDDVPIPEGTSPFVGESAGRRGTSTEAEPQPHLRQEDVKGPQMSDTLTGQATPIDPKDRDDQLPQPKQEDVPKATKQRSSTETGEATIKPKDEKVPSASQDDVSGPQRSDTEEGEAEPKPKGSKRDTQIRKDSPQSKARGSTPAKPEEKRTGKKAPKTGKGGQAKR